MIGAFARKLAGSRESQRTDYEKLAESAPDAPPERFVEKFPHEGGDVFLAPLLEQLRAVLKRRSEETTVPRVSENR